MSFIEGVGDEVTAFFVVLAVIVLATLITFIGNGSHLYSQTPAHTVALPAQPEPVRQQQVSEVQSTNSVSVSNNLTTLHSAPYPVTGQWSPADNRYYRNVQTRDEPVEEVSDDTEEPSSSDDARPANNSEGADQQDPPQEATEVLEDTEESMPSSTTGIRIRLKYLDDTERTVTSPPTTRIGDFKRNHFTEDLENNKVVRLIFCGHLLRDNSTLESYRVINNSVVHVQVLQAQAGQARSSVSQNTDLDLSHLLWPLLTLVLGLCWIFYLKYPEFFSLISVGLLLVFTGSLLAFYCYVHQ